MAEMVHMREHPGLGERLLATTGLAGIPSWIRAHHERWDGSGYPDGLAGERISVEARILALCDSYDAMISDRPYRSRLSHVAALQEVDLNMGTQFDPWLADIFIRLMSSVR